MRNLLLLFLCFVIMTLYCDKGVDYDTPITITIRNRAGMTVSVYQEDDFLCSIRSDSDKVVSCYEGEMKIKTYALKYYKFTAKNNKTYTFDGSKVTES